MAGALLFQNLGNIVNEVYVGTTAAIVTGILRQSTETWHGEKADDFQKIFELINNVNWTETKDGAKTPPTDSRSQHQQAVQKVHPAQTRVLHNITDRERRPKREVLTMWRMTKLSKPLQEEQIQRKAATVLRSLDGVATKYKSISSVVSYACNFETGKEETARDVISDVIDKVVDKKGVKRAFSELISDETLFSHLATLRVPDWVILFFKLEARIPDSAWQTMLNLTSLGPSPG